MDRYREYLTASRRNLFYNIKHGETLWYRIRFWCFRPIALALMALHHGTGWLLERIKYPRCEACNDDGYMFAWPLDRDRNLEDEQWCECAIGRRLKERDEYQRMRDSRNGSDDGSGASATG